MTAKEMAEWYAYEQVEPFGEQQANWRTCVLASVIHNSQCTKKSQSKTPQDFWKDYFRTAESTQTEDDRIHQAKLITAALGGTFGNHQ